MAHVSLYRRFRPDTFDKMVRQEHVVRILKNQIKADSIGHAYLFTGPRGTGKTSVARIFARAVNCLSPVDGSPCGECPACVALKSGSLDVTEIDAASNNGVNEMRDLREKVQYPPVAGKYKVYIIDEVHMLTDSAFNALLKTLEEPPAHAIFILATTEPQKLPATILSRCMRLDFKLIPEEDLEGHLIRVLEDIGKPYEREAVSAIARAGAGSDRDMLSIAEMCIAYGDKLTYAGVTAVLGAADFRETCALVSALLSADSGAALEKTERILSEGKAVGVLCRDVLELLNQITVAKTCRTAEKLLALPHDLFAEVKKLAEHADGGAILRATEIFSKAETELRYSSSPRIALETAVMRVSCPAQDYDVEALLVRMNALEKELAELSSRLAHPLQGGAGEHSEAEGGIVSAPAAPAPAKVDPVPVQEEEYPFPEEEPVFEEAYFSDEPAHPERKQERPKASEPAPVTESTPAPIAPVQTTASVPTDAQAAFGQFMRLLRKTSRSGVLFTMCSDLEPALEGGRLVLYSDSETVVRSLKREDHAATVAQVFAQIGITEYEVRLKGAKGNDAGGIEEIKRNFRDYPIEIK